MLIAVVIRWNPIAAVRRITIGETARAEALVGRNIDEWLRGEAPITPTIILVTQDGCPACGMAKAQRGAHGIEYQEVPVCSGSESECFETEGELVTVPMIFHVDVGRQIVFARTGWPTGPVEREELLRKLRSIKQE